jgi:hypothetical protein
VGIGIAPSHKLHVQTASNFTAKIGTGFGWGGLTATSPVIELSRSSDGLMGVASIGSINNQDMVIRSLGSTLIYSDTTLGATITSTGITTTGRIIANDIRLATSGGTAASLDHYEESTITLTFTAPSVSQVATLYCNRVGKIVTINIAEFMGVASSPGRLESSGTLPVRFRPVWTFRVSLPVLNNNVDQLGVMEITSSGQIFIYTNSQFSNFAAGTCGVRYCFITYHLF